MKKIKIQSLLKLSAVAFLTFSVSGCVLGALGVVAGTATVAGSSNSVSTQLADGKIEYRIITNINNTVPDNKINVKVWDGYTLLAGSVYTEDDKNRAIQAYSLIKGIDPNRIYNYILVKPKETITRNSGRISEDVRIKTELNSKLLLTKGIQSLRVETVVSYGRVFLFGTVSSENQKVITDIARKIKGVTNVYTLFR